MSRTVEEMEAELRRLAKELKRSQRAAEQWRRTAETSDSMSSQGKRALMKSYRELGESVTALQEEKARAERLARVVPGAVILSRVMAGAELAAVIAGAELAVGLDSGLMHLSAALGVPGVWLYGPTDPGLTGPYGEGQTVVQSTWPQAPCRRRTCTDIPEGDCCMRAITVEEVSAGLGEGASPA